MDKNDLISVIIPVKNGSRGNYLNQAIEGIQKQGMNTEIIVVDDGSEDNTAEIAKQYGCKVVRHESSKGPVISKNDGIKIAKGKYIMFHDHDDILRDGSLKKLYDELTSDDNISAVEAKVQDWYSPELSDDDKKSIQKKPEAYWGLFTGAILMKKAIFDVIGLFNESIKAGEIIEWQSKTHSAGLTVKKLDFVSTNRRLHSSNFGRTNKKTEFKDYAALLRARLAAGK